VREKNKESLRLMDQLIEKMEKLIAKAEQANNNKKRKNEEESNNDLPESKRLKGEEVANEVKQDIAKNDEEVSNKLTNLLQGMAGKTEEEKESDLAEIEKLKNEGKVYENQKDKINEKKDELAKNNPQGYGKMMAEILEKKIREFKVEITELAQAIREKLNQLKNGEITSDSEVRQAEEEVSVAVSEEVAKVELKNFMTEAQKLLKSTANKLQQPIEEMKKRLYNFKFSTNVFQQKAYQTEKSQVEKLERELENYSVKSNAIQPTDVLP
jgi:hypothetical protein